VLMSDLLFTISMQGFDHVTYTGDEPPKDWAMGPGRVLYGGLTGQFGTLSFNPSIEPVIKVGSELTETHLLLKGVSPSAATADPKYMSALAQSVANQPMLEHRSRRVPVMREVEQDQLWPLMTWLDPELRNAGLTQARLEFNPGELAQTLDRATEMSLSKQYVEAGISTWAREMVRLGLAPDEQSASALIATFAATNQSDEPDEPEPRAGDGQAD